jgi:hypothetical protein
MADDNDRLQRLVEGEHAWPSQGSGEPATMLDASLLADRLVHALDRIERLEKLVREHRIGTPGGS